MGREVLAISGLGVALGGRPILTDVNFALDAGEFVGLIGANGSGKTTLIRTILGFVKPSAGAIDVDRAAVGYVPQKIALDPYLPMRARDLVALGLDGHRLGLPWPSASKRRKVEEMLEAVEASAFADQRIGNLSGGQQQRVLIAHALIRRPRLLLLDEPLANLDMRSVAGVVGLLRRVAGAFGATVLISAHDMNPLLPAMDRIVYLAQGRAMAGKADAVVRTEVLSRLYGYHIDVVRVHGRVLVVAAEAEHAAHDALARHPAHIDTIPDMDLLTAIFEPGFFASAPVRTAALVGGAAALVSGVVGVFTVLRGQSFAGHALADVSSAGGAAAFFLGIPPLLGFLGMSALAAAGMEAFRASQPGERDLVTGIVTGAGLGLAALMLYLDVTTSHVTGAAVTIMFGSMFAISASLAAPALALAALAIGVVALVYRPLLLCSLDPDLAAVRGVPVRTIEIVHLIVAALAVALSALAVGAILSTALLIGPAAIALRLARRPGAAILLAAALGVAATWAGILIAYDSYVWSGGHGWPVSFCIVALLFAGYVAVPSRATAG